MAQTAVALLCVGSLLVWDDVAVVRCVHPATPFARPAPPMVVPRIQTWGSRPSRQTWLKEEPNLLISTRPHPRRAMWANLGMTEHRPQSNEMVSRCNKTPSDERAWP
jgi:hypothetical protein